MTDASETRTASSTGGEKGVKLARFELLPAGPLAEVAARFGLGAMKYEHRNWERGYEWGKSFGALMRHAQAFWQGEDDDDLGEEAFRAAGLDPEDFKVNGRVPGSAHLAGVAFHALALMEWMDTHPEFDDRVTTARPKTFEEESEGERRDHIAEGLRSRSGDPVVGYAQRWIEDYDPVQSPPFQLPAPLSLGFLQKFGYQNVAVSVDDLTHEPALADVIRSEVHEDTPQERMVKSVVEASERELQDGINAMHANLDMIDPDWKRKAEARLWNELPKPWDRELGVGRLEPLDPIDRGE